MKRRSIDLRRGGGGPPIGPGASRADIHPELTMEKIQNPPDGRRGVLTSFGSRLETKRFRQFIYCNFATVFCIENTVDNVSLLNSNLSIVNTFLRKILGEC